MELNSFIIRRVKILVVKIDLTRRMEYQMNFLERRPTEVYTRFRNFRIDNLEDWFYYCGYAWLRLRPVQLLHPQEGFLIISQHAPEWIFGVEVKLRKHDVALLLLVPNLKEDQSAVVLVVYQVLESISAVHCQETNEINHNQKEIRDWHWREFLSSSFFYSHQSRLQEFEINHQLLRSHFL